MSDKDDTGTHNTGEQLDAAEREEAKRRLLGLFARLDVMPPRMG
ncbi:hypothetical protein [Micromonospora sp. NPDC047527]